MLTIRLLLTSADPCEWGESQICWLYKMEFGISLDPFSVPQRHALYDSDEEDEQADTQQADFVFQPSTLDSTHKNNTLVVAIGQTACIFAKSFFTLSPLSTLEASTRGIFQGTYFPKTGEGSCLVSELMCADGGDVVFCLHEKNLKPEHVMAWFKKVFGVVSPTRVLILTCLCAYMHFSPHSDELSPQTCFLRTMSTSSWSQPLFDGAITLEPPNTLSGETAAVLTVCQLAAISGAVAVLYTKSSESTSEQVAGFTPLLDIPIISPLAKRSPSEAAKIVKVMKPKPREDLSSLYT